MAFSLLEAFGIGTGVALPAGLGTWLFLQYKKQREGVLVPVGGLTSRYGPLVGALLWLSCLAMLGFSGHYVGWWALFSALVVWLLAWRLAGCIERALYASQQLDELPRLLASMVLRFGHKEGLRLWQSGVPKWWISLMGTRWRHECDRRVGIALSSAESNTTAHQLQ